MVYMRKTKRYVWLYALITVLVVAGAIKFFSGSVLIYNANAAPLPTGENPNFLRQVTQCFLPVATIYGYDLRITAEFRSIAEQEQIYDSGRTEDGHIVSEAPPGHSLHNYGYAVDVVDREAGYDIDWDKLIAIGNYCSLESGGAPTF